MADELRKISKEDLQGILEQHTLWARSIDKSEGKQANLSYTDLKGMELNKADFTEANLRHADFSCAALEGARFYDADLSHCRFANSNLCKSDFVNANLTEADFENAKLRGAVFHEANLYQVSLRQADLSEAKLSTTHLVNADVSSANFTNVDFRFANLVGCTLDGAVLTGVWLWETLRARWSIKNVICEYVYWDDKRKIPNYYKPGEFERAYSSKPTIWLRYPGGTEPVELAMLPFFLDKLQQQYEGMTFSFHSMKDDGQAVLEIVVDDELDRSAEELQIQLNQATEILQHVQARVHQLTNNSLSLPEKMDRVREALPISPQPSSSSPISSAKFTQHLQQADLHTLCEAAIQCNLHHQWPALNACLRAAFVASLSQEGTPDARMLATLGRLNQIERLGDGTVPLRIWLENAAFLSRDYPQTQVFQDALERLVR